MHTEFAAGFLFIMLSTLWNTEFDWVRTRPFNFNADVSHARVPFLRVVYASR